MHSKIHIASIVLYLACLFAIPTLAEGPAEALTNTDSELSAGQQPPIDLEELPERAGERPRTSGAPEGTNVAHEQLSDQGPPALQEVLFALAADLPGVETGPSHVSVPGARAFHLSADLEGLNPRGLMVVREFAHLHPAYDGSLHLKLPPEVATEVLAKGWGEPHPRDAKTLMVYGPRTGRELEVVWAVVQSSYDYALGTAEVPSPSGEDAR